MLEAGRHIVTRIVEDPEVRSLDHERMTAFLQSQIEDMPFVQFMYATDMNGEKITRNVTQIEDKAKYAEYDEVASSYADRSWFQGPVTSGKISVTDVYQSKVTGRLTITISAPIYDMNDQMGGVFGLDVRFEELVRLEENQEY